MNSQSTLPSPVAQREGFPYIYHLLHMANLRSVLAHGLLSRRAVDARGIKVSSLQSGPVRIARSRPLVLPDGRTRPLDHFLSLRWFPSTPILANLAYDWTVGRYSRERQEFLVLLEVAVEALDRAEELWFATASPLSRDFSLVGPGEFELIPWERLRQARERHGDFSDPISASEILVEGVVAPEYFRACVVCSERAAARLHSMGIQLPVRSQPDWFFGCDRD